MYTACSVQLLCHPPIHLHRTQSPSTATEAWMPWPVQFKRRLECFSGYRLKSFSLHLNLDRCLLLHNIFLQLQMSKIVIFPFTLKTPLPLKFNISPNKLKDRYRILITLIQTSCSTTEARSNPCSAWCMNSSPRTVPTKMWPIARTRSGRKAWITSNWWTVWPMLAAEKDKINCWN